MMRRIPSAFAGALSGSALTAGGVWNLRAEEEAEGGEVIDMTALLGPASQGQDLDHGLRRGGVSASDHALPDLSAGTLRTSWSRGVGRELGVFRLV